MCDCKEDCGCDCMGTSTIILTDEDGNDLEFELIAELEVEDRQFVILAQEDDEDAVAFEIVESGEESTLVPLEEDEMFEKVAKAYEEYISSLGCSCK